MTLKNNHLIVETEERTVSMYLRVFSYSFSIKIEQFKTFWWKIIVVCTFFKFEKILVVALLVTYIEIQNLINSI